MKTKTTHTPGPWDWSPAPEFHVWAKGTPRIAIVPLRDVSINEQEANARLIAAAPELLEVAVELAAKGDDININFASGDDYRKFQWLLTMARAAIAKAEGGR